MTTNNTDSDHMGVNFEHVQELLISLKWLLPTADLPTQAASVFGRSIESSIAGLTANDTPQLITLRKQQTAVALSLEQYRQALLMKKQIEAFLSKKK